MRAFWGAGVALLAMTGVALADLPAGAPAPDFTTQAAMGGKVMPFSLAEALKTGPVVLYFYPAAFTPGCTEEAHDFADAMDRFHALGATVIGVSEDGIAKLQKFSVSECHSKFPVASDADGKIAGEYKATMFIPGYASRTSYVIAPPGTVIYAYSAMGPQKHVQNTMDAVQKWKAQQK